MATTAYNYSAATVRLSGSTLFLHFQQTALLISNFRSTNQIDFNISENLSLGVLVDYDYQTYLSYIDETNSLGLSPGDLRTFFYLKIKSSNKK